MQKIKIQIEFINNQIQSTVEGECMITACVTYQLAFY